MQLAVSTSNFQARGGPLWPHLPVWQVLGIVPQLLLRSIQVSLSLIRCLVQRANDGAASSGGSGSRGGSSDEKEDSDLRERQVEAESSREWAGHEKSSRGSTSRSDEQDKSNQRTSLKEAWDFTHEVADEDSPLAGRAGHEVGHAIDAGAEEEEDEQREGVDKADDRRCEAVGVGGGVLRICSEFRLLGWSKFSTRLKGQRLV